MCLFHSWGKWVLIIVTDGYGKKYDKQERMCKRCGYAQRKGFK